MVVVNKTLAGEVLFLCEDFDQSLLAFLAKNFASLMREVVSTVAPKIAKQWKKDNDVARGLEDFGHNFVVHLNPNHYMQLFKDDMELYGTERGISKAAWHIIRHEVMPNAIAALQLGALVSGQEMPDPEFVILMPVIHWFLKQYSVSDMSVF